MAHDSGANGGAHTLRCKIDGKIMLYDMAHGTKIDADIHWPQLNLQYLGEGTVYDIDGKLQNGKTITHFWAKRPVSSYTEKTFLSPEKMRLAGTGCLDGGFFVAKNKRDYKNSQGKMIDYMIGHKDRFGRTHETVIDRPAYFAFIKQAKSNFKKMKDIVKPGEKMTIKK